MSARSPLACLEKSSSPRMISAIFVACATIVAEELWINAGVARSESMISACRCSKRESRPDQRSGGARRGRASSRSGARAVSSSPPFMRRARELVAAVHAASACRTCATPKPERAGAPPPPPLPGEARETRARNAFEAEGGEPSGRTGVWQRWRSTSTQRAAAAWNALCTCSVHSRRAAMELSLRGLDGATVNTALTQEIRMPSTSDTSTPTTSTETEPRDRATDTTATEPETPRRPRGFAAMDRARVREISSQGGKAAHAAGTAHHFSSAEATTAGRKGGAAPHIRRGRPRTASARAATPSAAVGSGVAHVEPWPGERESE
jgi:general stress protein YciG